MLGVNGSYRLSDDQLVGKSPLAHFGANAADHLRRHDSFAHCPDLLVSGAYDPEQDEIAPFEEFMGSHGGLGGALPRGRCACGAARRAHPEQHD